MKFIRPGERVTLPRKRFEGGTNPSRAPQVMLDRPMFDVRPERNLGMPGIGRELPALPDEKLIAVFVDHGMPVWAAQELRRSPFARFNAVRFYFEVEAAQAGDSEARERVEIARAGWNDMRKAELIADTPSHTIGLWER